MTAGSEAFAGSSARALLLERERELTALRGVIGEATGGQSRVVMVEGPAGIGKTRLLAEARRLAAEAGLRVLGARGGELEREFAFGVVRQLLEPSLDGRDSSAFDGAAAAARSVFEPGRAPARMDQSDDPSFASLHGLYWMTVNLAADAPLVIAIDDLHWCDSPSLRFLAYLVRRLEGLAVLVICTLRPAERVDSTPLGEITGDPLTVSIHPGVLSAPGAARARARAAGRERRRGVLIRHATPRRAVTRFSFTSCSRRWRPKGCGPTPRMSQRSRTSGPGRVALGSGAARSAVDGGGEGGAGGGRARR